jgi:osmoprotectant transport system permease protein
LIGPLFDPGWVSDQAGELVAQTREHVVLTLIAVALGLLISLPLGIYAHRHRRALTPIVSVTGILYTIPSVALFASLVPFFGLSTTTGEIGLVSYTLLILIRNIVAGLRGVPDDAKEAALGMGYTRRQLLWEVEVPLAAPAILAGIRIATVTTIGLVTVTALVGLGGLGRSIFLGLQRFFPTAIIAGALLSVLLAVIADRLLLLAERRVTPWAARRAA